MKESRLKEREQKLVKAERAIKERLGRERQRVFERFPLLFTLLGSFGLVATFYGFEGVIDKIDVFRDNPYLLLGTGIIVLIITGSLYKRLQ